MEYRNDGQGNCSLPLALSPARSGLPASGWLARFSEGIRSPADGRGSRQGVHCVSNGKMRDQGIREIKSRLKTAIENGEVREHVARGGRSRKRKHAWFSCWYLLRMFWAGPWICGYLWRSVSQCSLRSWRLCAKYIVSLS